MIGVHAGKYPNERRTPHIAHAARRLRVTHPIVNDRMFRLWRAYGINAWPTLALIDPEGRYLTQRIGEGSAAAIGELLPALIEAHRAAGTPDPQPQPHAIVDHDPDHGLRYPEKLLADDRGRLVIADTGHDRIIVTTIHGATLRIERVIGSGVRGYRDGSFATACFDQPRGLALLDETLYVADTANHRLRAIDLRGGTVSTVAGTGARGIDPPTAGPGLRIALASPWDAVAHRGTLVIAVAGLHQLWRFEPGDGTLILLAGNGREALEDGALHEAALAQPCGITSDGTTLFWADSEAQAIRRIDRETVTTIVGTGLFDYGDGDGTGDAVALQHPQALIAYGDRLYVADSYNHKIKIVDPATRRCWTWLGRRRIAGDQDGDADMAAFAEPGGMSIGNRTLFIADTNNHAVRAADLDSGQVRTLTITDWPSATQEHDERDESTV